ncbi:hypothetical protein A6V25_11640 [Nostoc sp. ATCC 53789]|jgi:hypothetical protein|nr:hypothetical protein A6V25_11640 [Nostoc sp. ATCC 53789]
MSQAHGNIILLSGDIIYTSTYDHAETASQACYLQKTKSYSTQQGNHQKHQCAKHRAFETLLI